MNARTEHRSAKYDDDETGICFIKMEITTIKIGRQYIKRKINYLCDVIAENLIAIRYDEQSIVSGRKSFGVSC